MHQHQARSRQAPQRRAEVWPLLAAQENLPVPRLCSCALSFPLPSMVLSAHIILYADGPYRDLREEARIRPESASSNCKCSCLPLSNPRRLISRRQGSLQGVSKKERLARRFPRGWFRGRNPIETGLFCCLTKLCIIPAIYGSQKEDGWTQPGHGWKCGRNHDQVLGVCTGRRMAQPEADRRPLRLRAMPPGRLWRKRRNPHHAGCHNNRAGPCGRLRRLRGAVVGGTGGQRSSMTTPDIGWHYSRMEGAVTLLSGGPHCE